MSANIIQLIQRHIVPPLSNSFHKGEAGRIAVLGGCEEYTGAPFYASESSLRSGCDLSFVFCTKDASVPIKSYSPEIIVYPFLYDGEEGSSDETEKLVSRSVSKIQEIFPRLHSLIIGPGMGRNRNVLQVASQVIQKAKEKEVPLVIDGDGLYLVSQNPSLIKGYKHTVLLPNPVEYKRIYESVFPDKANSDDESKDADTKMLEQLCNELGNVTIVKKGSVDLISNGKLTLKCEEEGSLRRSGGQGDVLSGITGTFVHWAHWSQERSKKNKEDQKDKNTQPKGLEDSIVYACYAACTLTRKCAKEAFKKSYRSTTAPDLIAQLPHVLQDTFPYQIEQVEY